MRCAGEVNYFRYYKKLGPIAKLATSYRQAVTLILSSGSPPRSLASPNSRLMRLIGREDWAKILLLASCCQEGSAPYRAQRAAETVRKAYAADAAQEEAALAYAAIF